MSEKELNAYRFSPEQEPTDEMLSGAGAYGRNAGTNHEGSCRGSENKQPKGDGGALETNAAKRFDKTSKMGERHRKHTEWTQINAYRK